MIETLLRTVKTPAIGSFAFFYFLASPADGATGNLNSQTYLPLKHSAPIIQVTQDERSIDEKLKIGDESLTRKDYKMAIAMYGEVIAFSTKEENKIKGYFGRARARVELAESTFGNYSLYDGALNDLTAVVDSQKGKKLEREVLYLQAKAWKNGIKAKNPLKALEAFEDVIAYQVGDHIEEDSLWLVAELHYDCFSFDERFSLSVSEKNLNKLLKRFGEGIHAGKAQLRLNEIERINRHQSKKAKDKKPNNF